MSHEQQITTLREEIRRAGEAAFKLRFCAWTVVVAACLPAVSLLWTLLGIVLPGELAALCAGLLGVVWIVVGPVVGARLAARAYRGYREPLIRERLEQIPRERLEECLRPLCREGDDIRELVVPLLLQIGTPTEVAPAPAPDARGDEASPAESAPLPTSNKSPRCGRAVG